MTTDDILRMAREQGLPETEVEGVFRVNSDDLGRLLAAERNRMIADGWRQCAQGQRTSQHCGMVEQARQEEREACAKVCDELADRDKLSNYYRIAANAIRAQAEDRLARHGIPMPDEDDHDGNPSF